jgi:hypothetical protein
MDSRDKHALRLMCKRLRELGDAAVSRSRVNTLAGASAEELRKALSRWRGVRELMMRLMDPNAADLLNQLSCAGLPRLRELTIYQVSAPKQLHACAL